MRIILKAIQIGNTWALHNKYKGPLGIIRKLRKGRLEKAHGLKLKFGEKEIIIDLSYLEPQMDKGTFLLVPPLSCEKNEGVDFDTIPHEADMAPRDIDLIWVKDGKKSNGVV
jgi:hypothetical protein